MAWARQKIDTSLKDATFSFGGLATSFLHSPGSYLSFGRGLDVRVAGVTDDVIHLLHGSLRDGREGALAVVGKVAIDLPRLAKVGRALNCHGGWSERLRAGSHFHLEVMSEDNSLTEVQSSAAEGV